MDDRNRKKKERIAFYVLVLVILIGFVAAELIYPSERSAASEESRLHYEGEVLWEKSDGTSEVIEVPGTYEVPAGETMVLKLQLPEDYYRNTIGIRVSLQEAKFYIDGELRSSYDTRDTRPFGKDSASRYVFCDISEKDAGKILRLELTTHTSNYSGVVNTIYYGNMGDIWVNLFAEYIAGTMLAVFILLAGVLTIVFSMALGVVYKVKFDMEFVGWCMVFGGIWMLGESKLRQFWIPNASVLAAMCFIMMMLCPLPLLFYVDSVQKGRYTKLYRVMEAIVLLNFLLCFGLQVSGRLDFIETMPLDHAVLLLTCIVICATFVRDIWIGKSWEYYMIRIGVVVLMVCILLEALSTYFVVLLSGFASAFGLMVMLFVNIIRTMNSVQHMEQQRHQEEVDHIRKQAEKMSLQMIRTLTATLEEKNEYMKGHSQRVAQYSALIAEELGWSRKEIRNLKNAVYTHDAGKIGISETLLNKPSRLSEEEYEIMKEHTTIGADILMNITMVEHATEVAKYHHERYDGTGYPEGLAGEQIPIHARIAAVADSYDAMNTKRIYRDALSEEEIYGEIEKGKGTQFDPVIADVFLKLLQEGRIVLEEAELEEETVDELTELERETGKFISDIMVTMKSQETSDSFDYLTGLPMRSRGESMIAQRMQKQNGCLVFLDMDNLKKINDIYGHKVGDRVLKLLGEQLAKVTEEGVACRFGGDEFVLFFAEMKREETAEKMQQLFEAFQTEKEKDPEIRSATLSAGICVTRKGDAFESCYANADKALYYVKQNGKNQFIFCDQIENTNKNDTASGRDLRRIADALKESGSYSGALNMDLRNFSKLYAYMNHLGARYHYESYLVLLTLDTIPERTVSMEQIEYALECLEKSVQEKIRGADICTRYNIMQYLILLFEPEESQIPNVMERIFMQYEQLYGKDDFKLRYEYILVTEKHS